MPYSYRAHTAEIEFVASGRSLRAMFRSALLAVFDTSAEVARLRRMRGRAYRVRIRESSRELRELLWSALQGAVSQADARGLFLYGVESLAVRKEEGVYRLDAVLLGRRVGAEYSRLEVKGVSMYDIRVTLRSGVYKAEVVLDV